jgi:hypothetical protein
VEILKKTYASREAAAAQIPAALAAFYRDTYPAIYKERQAEVPDRSELTRYLQPECVSGDENHLGDISE